MEASPAKLEKSVTQTRLVLIMAAVQFVNVLDFVMVMPLGPDFAVALGIPMSQIGVVGGAYTLAAAVSGIGCSFFLDRFDRRSALGVTMLGLVLATLAGGLSVGMGSLVASRVVAGMFGGPATSLAIAAVTDVVPKERRGRAMGTVMAAFSVASVLGVPAGLEAARLFGWRAPFVGVSALGIVVASLAVSMLPPLKDHLKQRSPVIETPSNPTPEAQAIIPAKRFEGILHLFDGLSMLALCSTFLVTLGVFLIVPNISAYFQYNLGYPREHLGLLYLVGGCASFIALKLVGNLVDRFGATRFVVLGTALNVAALWFGFIDVSWGVPSMAIFVSFMLSGSIRMVPTASLATRVPSPERRASFMSAQSAVRHTGSALGAMLGAAVLVAEPSGKLVHIEWVAGAAALLALCVPLLTSRIEVGVLRREVASA